MTSIDFEALFLSLPSPHMILDRNLVYVAANRAYEEAVLRRSAELVGRSLFELFPDDGESGRRLRASLERVLETGEADTIAFIPYHIPRPAELGGGSDLRYWSASHTPLNGPDGKVAYIVQNTVDVTEVVQLKQAASMPLRSVSGEAALLQRAREVEEAYRESVSQSLGFRQLFQQAPGLIAVLQSESHVFTFANDAYLRFVGGRDVIGLPAREALPEIRGQGFFRMLDDVYRNGCSHGGEAVPVVLQRRPGSLPEEAFMDFSYNPIRNSAGDVTGIFVQGTDRTDSMRAVQRQRLLIDELNHRVKNTLATVQSIARQSFRHDRHDPARARDAFEARLMALSKAHNLLSERHWQAAAMTLLLQQEFAAFDAGRIRLSGPEVHLSSKAAIALAMVFHELAANAARYGALATRDGWLAVEWSRTEPVGHEILDVSWRESGLRGPAGPLRPGFGIRLLQRIIEDELGGDLDLDLEANGLICGFQISMSEVENLGC